MRPASRWAAFLPCFLPMVVDFDLKLPSLKTIQASSGSAIRLRPQIVSTLTQKEKWPRMETLLPLWRVFENV